MPTATSTACGRRNFCPSTESKNCPPPVFRNRRRLYFAKPFIFLLYEWKERIYIIIVRHKASGVRLLDYQRERKEETIMKALLSEKNRRLALAVLGTLIFAAGMNLFIVPLNLYSGGFLGIGQIVRTLLVDYAHVPIPSNIDIAGIILYIINIPLLVLAYRSLGRWFFVSTIICVTFQTVFLTFIPSPVPPSCRISWPEPSSAA